MTVYLDLCSLKRPFDDQRQAQIALETAAVLAILKAVADGRLTAVRSATHDLENSRNPDNRRAAAVGAWLEARNPIEPTPAALLARMRHLQKVGLRGLDASHLAWAEHLEANVLITTDRQFLSRCQRLGHTIKVRVTDPVTFAGELAR